MLRYVSGIWPSHRNKESRAARGSQVEDQREGWSSGRWKGSHNSCGKSGAECSGSHAAAHRSCSHSCRSYSGQLGPETDATRFSSVFYCIFETQLRFLTDTSAVSSSSRGVLSFEPPAFGSDRGCSLGDRPSRRVAVTIAASACPHCSARRSVRPLFLTSSK